MSARQCEDFQPSDIDGYQVEQVASAAQISPDLLQAVAQYKRYVPWDVGDLLDRGSVVWVGRLGGQIAFLGITWRGDRKSSWFFPLTPQCAVISHCVTLPACRGLGLYPMTLGHIVRELAKDGITRFYVDCDDWNVPSVRGIERAGFRRIGRCVTRRGGRVVWYQEARPDFAVGD